VDLPGEYNYKPNRGAITGDTIPVWSEDGERWTHLRDVEYDAQVPRLRIRLRPATNRVWIAHVPPYTNHDLARLLRDAGAHPHFRREGIGRSAGGRPLSVLTVTNPAIAEKGKKGIWLMFRQHSWEAGSSWVGEGALRFLLSEEAAAIRDSVVFRIIPLCDPDGVARGGVRFNAHGYDLNRNWDRAIPGKMPEIDAQRKAILEWVDAGRPLHLFLSLHNTETGEYLEAPPGEEYAPLGNRFFRLLRETTEFHSTEPLRIAGETTTQGREGRMTVIQGLYRDRKLPAFLMEQMIAYNERLGRPPLVDDRLRFGGQLVRAMVATVK
jgi:hypothetical protein